MCLYTARKKKQNIKHNYHFFEKDSRCLPFFLSSRKQNNLFGSGKVQFECIIPFAFWPHSFSKSWPIGKLTSFLG